MKKGDGSKINSRAGITASGISLTSYLRICPDCYKQDIKKYGEPYWHRLHQIPGVLVCPHHYKILKINTKEILSRNRLIVPENDDNCLVSDPKLEHLDSKTYGNLKNMASDTKWFMQQLIEPQKSLNRIEEKYVNNLIKKGYASNNGTVSNLKKLCEDFIEYFGEEFLQIMQSTINYNKNDNWLKNIFRKHRGSFHPLRHLLVMQFLEGSIKNFLESSHDYVPFGLPPWPCLNPAAEHYKKLLVNEVEIKQDYNSKKPKGIFKCSCGFIYSRKGFDNKEEDKYYYDNVIEYGDVWLEKLIHYINVEKLSYNKTAKKLNVSNVTIKNIYKNVQYREVTFNINKKYVYKNKPKKDIMNLKKQQYRDKWKKNQESHPDLSRQELIKLQPGVYRWLKKYDGEWFEVNSPTFKSSRHYKNYKDWNARDLKVLEEVKKVSNDLIKEGKLKRITKSRIGEKLGLRDILYKKIDNMPLTKNHLEEITESIEEFQIRRIKFYIDKLEREGEKVTKTKIRTLAGVDSPDLIVKVFNGEV